MPAKTTRWDKLMVGHVLALLDATGQVVRVEVGYQQWDEKEPNEKRQRTTVITTGAAIVAMQTVVDGLVADTKTKEGV